MVWDPSFMSQRRLFNMSNIYLEGFEARSKVSKNGKWHVISSFQKWQVFGPHSTWLSNIKEASNEFLLNMKVEYLSLPFPKSPRSWISNEWLRSYGQIIAKCAWNFKWPYLLNQNSKFGGSFCKMFLMSWSFQNIYHIA